MTLIVTLKTPLKNLTAHDCSQDWRYSPYLFTLSYCSLDCFYYKTNNYRMTNHNAKHYIGIDEANCMQPSQQISGKNSVSK